MTRPALTLGCVPALGSLHSQLLRPTSAQPKRASSGHSFRPLSSGGGGTRHNWLGLR